MSIEASTLDQFHEKSVILHRITADGSVVELEGRCEAASEVGVAFKEKGKREVELILPDEIDEISIAPEKPKTITQKKLKPTTESTVRQHLADRHGMTRKKVNKLSDAEAFKMHEELDHSDLGHKHVADEDENENEASESESDAA